MGTSVERLARVTRRAGSGAEELSRLKRAVAEEIISYTVEGVAAAFGHHVNPRRPVAIGRVHEIFLDFKLRHVVEGQRDRGIVDVLHGKVDAVELCISAVVDACAAYRNAAVIHNTAAAGRLDRSRRERDQVEEIARIERQFQHGPGVHHGPDRCRVGLQQWGRGLHRVP